jgi:hypothetical protein
MDGDGMFNDQRNARVPAQPLPEARRLRRALESLGVTTHTGPRVPNPFGERGDAAQYAGTLHAMLEQVETALRGGELQPQFQKGWLNAYNRDVPGALGATALQIADMVQFAGEGMGRVPAAAQQLSTAVYALLVAQRAFSAAAELATSEQAGVDAAVELSQKMVLNAQELGRWAEKLHAEFGVVGGEPDLPMSL